MMSLKVSRSVCGKYVKVQLSGGQTEVFTISDWSKALGAGSEFMVSPHEKVSAEGK